MSTDGLKDRLEGVRARIGAAAGRAGRDPADVTLVGVMKVVEPDAVERAAAWGLRDVGTNRAQQVRDNASLVPVGTRWHFLGAVQTNKVRYLDDVWLVHGLARDEEAAALQHRAEHAGRERDVLIEVNVAGEASKNGVAPEALPRLVERLGAYPLVRPRGLMIVAPQVENHEDVRWVFARGRQLRDDVASVLPAMRELSMGMSDDYEIAIEEGATIVRIGRGIFGARPRVSPGGASPARMES